MPSNKDFKRLVRGRMQKTGESYSTARSQLLRKKPASAEQPAAPSATDHAKLAGMSNDAVKAKTGRTWAQWVKMLNQVDAATWPHRKIADHVVDETGLDGWWAQTVTVGYERIRGLRDIGQRRGGSYEASKSKTLAVPIGKLYKAFSDKRQRARWLPKVDLTVRTATREKSMRITWSDGTSVEVYFTKKGTAKSQVAVQHRKLPSKAAANESKVFWTDRLGALAELLAALG